MENQEINLKHLVDNKKVVIIGPSGSVDDNKKEHIEKYDVIIRINHGWPVNPTLIESIGERIDVLYHHTSGLNLEKTLNEDLAKKVKLIRYDRERKKANDLEVFCKTHSIPHTPFNESRISLNKIVHTHPNTGFLAIHETLKCNIEELYITGFTFYREPYYKGHVTTKMSSDKEVINRNTMHNSDMMLDYFIKELYKKDSRIKIDNALRKVINNRPNEIALENSPMDLKHIVDNKRVVIIGPSRCVIANKKEHIEKYDVIIRINLGWPVEPTLIDSIGERIDVLYHHCGRLLNRTLNEDLAKKVKLICLADNKDKSYLVDEFCQTHSILHTPTYQRRRSLNKIVHTIVTTGFFAIWETLKCNIEELYITGFTFYREPYHEGYVATLHGNSEKVFLRNTKHNNDIMLDYFIELYKKDSRIKIDNALRKVINNRPNEIIFDDIVKKCKTLKRAARSLNIMKYPLPEGEKEWTYVLVKKVIEGNA